MFAGIYDDLVTILYLMNRLSLFFFERQTLFFVSQKIYIFFVISVGVSALSFLFWNAFNQNIEADMAKMDIPAFHLIGCKLTECWRNYMKQYM